MTEVVGMEGDTITTQDIFTFDYAAGVDASGNYIGTLNPTGIRPRFTERLKDIGIHLPPEIFGDPDLVIANISKADG